MSTHRRLQDVQIDDAKEIAKRRGWPAAIVLLVDPESGACCGASWGTDASNPKNWNWACKWAGKLLDSILSSLSRAMPVWQKKAREMKENQLNGPQGK